MERNQIYEDIACRTGGDIYIGVGGPVGTGKTTFIKRVLGTMGIPHIDNEYRRGGAPGGVDPSGARRAPPPERRPLVLGGARVVQQ